MGFWGLISLTHNDPTTALEGLDSVDPVAGVWRAVARRLYGDQFSGPIVDDVEALAKHSGALLAAAVFDSDGAWLSIGVPGRDVGYFWLQFDGAFGYFFPPWAPFDDEGEQLSVDAEAEQAAEWEREAELVRRQLLSVAMPVDEAAAMCRDCALAMGLTPGSVEEIKTALTAENVFVEETVHQLHASLGCRQEPA